MKIRSITYFLNPGWPVKRGMLKKAGGVLDHARAAMQAGGYEVQTTRLATVPFPRLLRGEIGETLALAQAVEEAARQAGIDYVSLGPALPEYPKSYPAIPEALAVTQNVFFGGVMTTGARICLPAVRACAHVILRAAQVGADGFANLRFAALAGVPPGAPFFPAAYHAGGRPVFAIATEAAALVVQAFTGAGTIGEAQQSLIDSLESHARSIAIIAESLSRQYSLRFAGIDFSLAPFPEEMRSLGTAFSRLGVERVGLHGSAAVAAIIAGAVDHARFPRAGFSGLFLPVLEDAVLAQCVAQGTLTLKDLLLYAALCGTGLDTIPLPGDVTAGQVNALLLDLAAVSVRLDKPLTARLMPIPGKHAGEPTGFDFAYFANSRVMTLEARALMGPLAGTEDVVIYPRGFGR